MPQRVSKIFIHFAGCINVSSVEIAAGDNKNKEASGAPKFGSFALSLHSSDDNRTVEIVLDSKEELEAFLGLVMRVSVQHNIQVRVYMCYYTIPYTIASSSVKTIFFFAVVSAVYWT
jgi:hypothetical protein